MYLGHPSTGAADQVDNLTLSFIPGLADIFLSARAARFTAGRSPEDALGHPLNGRGAHITARPTRGPR